MSETTTTTAAATSPGTQDSAIPTGNITGEQAKALVEAEKAKAASGRGGKTTDVKPAAPDDNKAAVAEAAKEAIRRFKVKVDGEELEVDEKELLRGYSHQKAANKILHEGKAARKQAEEFIAMMKDQGKLFEVIQKLGHDPRQLAEQYLAAQLEDETMDPRDKELRDAKAKLKKIEDLERQQREEVERQRTEELKAKYSAEYQTQFVEALKETALPPTKAMVAEMAKYISRSAKIGFKMTPSEAAQLVREDVQRAHASIIGESDGETLLKLLGDDVAAKILSARGSKVKSPEQNLKTPSEQGAPSERSKNTGKRMSSREWREYNRK